MSIARTSVVGSAQWSADSATVAPADGTVLLVSADPNRAAVTVQNDPDSTGDLWLVPNPGQGRGGIRVKPGGGAIIASTAAVYGYATLGPVAVYALSESGVSC